MALCAIFLGTSSREARGLMRRQLGQEVFYEERPRGTPVRRLCLPKGDIYSFHFQIMPCKISNRR